MSATTTPAGMMAELMSRHPPYISSPAADCDFTNKHYTHYVSPNYKGNQPTFMIPRPRLAPGPQGWDHTQPLAEATVKKSKARRAVEKFDSETECILTEGLSRPYCTVCKVDIIDSPKAVKQHLKSKPHKETVEKM